MSDPVLRHPDDIKLFTKDASCPKCMSRDIKSKHHPPGAWWCYTLEQEDLQVDWTSFDGIPQEHLVRTCVCGYHWLEWTADRTEPPQRTSRFDRDMPL